jgi:hypothetical protein
LEGSHFGAVSQNLFIAAGVILSACRPASSHFAERSRMIYGERCSMANEGGFTGIDECKAE